MRGKFRRNEGERSAGLEVTSKEEKANERYQYQALIHICPIFEPGSETCEFAATKKKTLHWRLIPGEGEALVFVFYSNTGSWVSTTYGWLYRFSRNMLLWLQKHQTRQDLNSGC